MKFDGNGNLDVAEQIKLKHVGRDYTPTKIVAHYTVTDTLKAAVNALNSVGKTGLAYHFLIEADGTINQTRPVAKHAAHAGNSNWKEPSGLKNSNSLNRDSVSISFINRGFFQHGSGETFFDLNAHGDPLGKIYDKDEVQVTSSIYDPSRNRNWHKYTEAQVQSAHGLIGALKAGFPSIKELVGHDDISIDGKFDTGPLFPMEKFREEFGLQGGLGFETTVKSPDGELTLRQRPTGSSKNLGTLRTGDTVHIRAVAYSSRVSKAIVVDRRRSRYLTKWASIDVDGSNKHAGFVHMKFLANTPLDASLKKRL